MSAMPLSLALLAGVAQVSVAVVTAVEAPLGPAGIRDLDLRAAARAFYDERPDAFDVLVLLPDFGTLADQGALYQPVANTVGGIGFDQGGRFPSDLDESAEYGSARLQGVVVLGALDGLADEGALDVVAQEVLHQFGATVRFVPAAGGPPHTGLLGRGGVHWSFFTDTGGSVLGGNRWEDTGGGRWRTGTPGGALAPFDLYLMGLLPPEDVPPMRWMASWTVLEPGRDDLGRPWSPASPPQAGVLVEGAWEAVGVEQVVAAHGQRSPAFPEAPSEFRHGWAVVALEGRDVSPERRAQADRLWSAWPDHFLELTGGRGTSVVTWDGASPAAGGGGCACGVGAKGPGPPGWLVGRRR